MRTIVLTMAIGFLVANVAVAAGRCAAPACSDQCGYEKACKVVMEMKKVKKTVWVVQCEEFCPPLPGCRRKSDPCCGGCGADCAETEVSCCDGCAKGCDPCAALRNRTIVPPKCGKVRTRKKLVKKEITCEVPVYKCAVAGCGSGCSDACGFGEEEGPATPPAQETTEAAPLPPVVGTSYLKLLNIGP